MIKNSIFFCVISFNLIFILFFQKKEIANEVKIIVEPGMQLNDISKNLYDNDLIKNKLIFVIWVKLNFSEKKLKFGEYLFGGKISMNSILEKLKDGKSLSRKITIVEGWSKTQFLELLNNLNHKKLLYIEDIPDEIIADTYFYQVSDDPKDILDNIVSKSRDMASKIWINRDKTIPLKNISELYTLASIVEKETSDKREKSVIPGVFYNRFEKNMRLQSDPTVVYAITLGKEKMKRKLLRKDLKFESKYNTYLNKGLPPSPICFPGLEAIKGTANPYKSNFLYFVSNKDGGHLFSSNYQDHLENIKKVRKIKK